MERAAELDAAWEKAAYADTFRPVVLDCSWYGICGMVMLAWYDAENAGVIYLTARRRNGRRRWRASRGAGIESSSYGMAAQEG